MKYKEFVRWCNERACDGCWSSNTAMICINIINNMKSISFWKRKREWNKISNDVYNEIVLPINRKIEELKRQKGKNNVYG